MNRKEAVTVCLVPADEWTTRDFDYGVGDELDTALRRARRQIADEIRRAAAADPSLTPDAERAYEQAARVAENWS